MLCFQVIPKCQCEWGTDGYVSMIIKQVETLGIITGGMILLEVFVNDNYFILLFHLRLLEYIHLHSWRD